MSMSPQSNIALLTRGASDTVRCPCRKSDSQVPRPTPCRCRMLHVSLLRGSLCELFVSVVDRLLENFTTETRRSTRVTLRNRYKMERIVFLERNTIQANFRR